MNRKVRVVVAGEDGKTRFEETEVEFHPIDDAVPGARFDAAPLGSSDVALVRFEPGFTAGFHLTPTPTWMFVLTGRLHLGVSDDVWAELGPGDFVYMKDTEGEGHRSRVIGGEDLLMVTAGYGG
jgi:quercetin dioxygenase-like cupin family protein